MDWEAMAAPWLRFEAETDAAHAPVRAALMQKAALRAGQSVLDVGPGAGISLLDAAQAVGPTGHVTGIEIAPPFATRAIARSPANVKVLVGDAAIYPFEPGAYDAAISLFGVMFFADPVAAFRRIRTACKPGAALTFACWGPPQANPWFSMPARVAAGIFGPGPAFDPDAPGPMAFGARDRIDRILSAAGWSVAIDTKELYLTPGGTPEDVANMQMSIGGAAMRMGVAQKTGAMTDAHRDAVRDGLTSGFAEMVKDGAVKVPALVHIVCATA